MSNSVSVVQMTQCRNIVTMRQDGHVWGTFVSQVMGSWMSGLCKWLNMWDMECGMRNALDEGMKGAMKETKEDL